MNSNVHQTNASQVIKKNTPLSQVVTDPKKNIQNDKKTPVVQNRTLSALDKKNIKDNRNNEEPNKS